MPDRMSVKLAVHASVHHILFDVAGLQYDQIDDKKPITELGIDSMTYVTCMYEVEKCFDIYIPDDTLKNQTLTLADIEAVIEKLVYEQGKSWNGTAT